MMAGEERGKLLHIDVILCLFRLPVPTVGQLLRYPVAFSASITADALRFYEGCASIGTI